ncbi:hypothetical protein, partial [Streptococcus pneumoniae]|uniref:hypothetical protein n=1 Tax=Streptococcus pneumoniae TaxID=1313 RepID=UPI0012D75B0F
MTITMQDTSITIGGQTVEEIDALMKYTSAEIMRIGDERDDLDMQIANLVRRNEALRARQIEIRRAELAKMVAS